MGARVEEFIVRRALREIANANGTQHCVHLNALQLGTHMNDMGKQIAFALRVVAWNAL